jgi:hypothetical protein
MFTAPLHSNGSYSIAACLFVAAGIYLPSRCLETAPVYFLISRSLNSNGSTCSNIMGEVQGD